MTVETIIGLRGSTGIGANNAYYSSDSLATWTLATTPDRSNGTGIGLVAFAFDGVSRGVAVADSADVASRALVYTDDFHTYTAGTNTIAATWEGVAYSPSLGLWVAVNTDHATNRIATSTDGQNWTGVAFNAAALSAVAWSPRLGMFVAVGASAIYTSTDGSTWTSRTNPVATTWTQVIWCDGPIQKFFAVSSSQQMYSADGVTWTSYASQLTGAIGQLAYSSDLGMIAIAGNSGSGYFNYSYTGLSGSWQVGGTFGGNSVKGVTWSVKDKVWYIVNGGGVFSSPLGFASTFTQKNTDSGANLLFAATVADTNSRGSASIVQFAEAVQDSGAALSVTLPVAPTANNVLLAFVRHFNNNTPEATGWHLYYNQNGGIQDGISVLYKIAGASESATQQPTTQTGNIGVAIYEVGPLDRIGMGAFGPEVHAVDQTSSPLSITLNVPEANGRVIGMMFGTSNPPATFTPDAAFTVDDTATPTTNRSQAMMHTAALTAGSHTFSNAFSTGRVGYSFIVLGTVPEVATNLPSNYVGGGLLDAPLTVWDGNIPTAFTGGGLFDVSLERNLQAPFVGGGLVTLDGLEIDIDVAFGGGGLIADPLGVIEEDLAINFTGGGTMDAPVEVGARVPTKLTQSYAQVLAGGPVDVKLTQSSAQVVGTATPNVKETQAYAQVMGTDVPNTRLTQTYVQVLALRTPLFDWHEDTMLVYEIFPNDISLNSQGSVGFNTDVVMVDSGADQRSSRWDQALMEYDVAYGVRTMEQLHSLISFFRAMRGKLYSFLFIDHVDHTSTLATRTEARAAPAISPEDQQIGVGDGLTKTFQLVKKYPTPTNTGNQIRNITKPKGGTTRVARDGLEVANFTVDLLTGIVTFTSEYSITKTLSIAQPGGAGTARITGAPDDFVNFLVGGYIVMTGWTDSNNNSTEAMVLSITNRATDRSYIDIAYDSTHFIFGQNNETATPNVTVRTHPAPATGVVVTAGFEFYVPVRFDTDKLPVTLEEYGVGSATQVKLVEVRPGEELLP